MRLTATGITALCVVASSAFAQDTTRTPVVCNGQRVDSIAIYTAAPVDSVQGAQRVRLVRELVRAIHVTTRPPVVRRLMVLQTGDSCTELKRLESERILRQEPFIAQATVQAFANDHGGVDLEVRTIDEASPIAAVHLESSAPTVSALEFGSSNIDGTGIYVADGWSAGEGYRDEYYARMLDQDLFGHPYLLSLQADRRSLGQDYEGAVSHAFTTDLQRFAWVVRGGSVIDYITFPTDSSVDRAVRLDRNYFDVGGIARLGPPGRFSLLGASISSDDERPAQLPVLVTDTGLAPDTNHTLIDRYQPHRMARLNVLWGIHDIHYARVEGLDALLATQDVPIGFELGTLFGRSVVALGSADNDFFTASSLYIGAGGEHGVFRLQLQGEGRRDLDANLWDGILTSGRAAELLHLARNETFITSVEWSGGWREQIPFNLTLSDPDGGVRGFGESETPGARRLAERVESRWVLGKVREVGELGVAIFTDAGRLWAGDVPFGVNTPTRRSIGVSLLGAFPAQSARLWRLDFAFAENPEQYGQHLELRFSGEDATRLFFHEPSDVERARERTVPSSVFRWP